MFVCVPILAQTQAILNARLKEELNISLSISVYDVARNENARTHRKEQEAKRAEEERIRKEKEMDYLAPFLARIGDPPKLTRQQIEEVTQVMFACLAPSLITLFPTHKAILNSSPGYPILISTRHETLKMDGNTFVYRAWE